MKQVRSRDNAFHIMKNWVKKEMSWNVMWKMLSSSWYPRFLTYIPMVSSSRSFRHSSGSPSVMKLNFLSDSFTGLTKWLFCDMYQASMQYRQLLRLLNQPFCLPIFCFFPNALCGLHPEPHCDNNHGRSSNLFNFSNPFNSETVWHFLKREVAVNRRSISVEIKWR